MTLLILPSSPKKNRIELGQESASITAGFSASNRRIVGMLSLFADRGSDVTLGDKTIASAMPVAASGDASIQIPVNYRDPKTFAMAMQASSDYSLTLDKTGFSFPVKLGSAGIFSLSLSSIAITPNSAISNSGDYSLTSSQVSISPTAAIVSAAGQIYATDRDTNDPYLNTLNSLLLNFEGADGSQSIFDSYGKVITAYNSAQIKTSNHAFGSSSCYFNGTSSYLGSNVAYADLAFGSLDFTIEAFIYPTAFGSPRTLLDTRQTASGSGLAISTDASGKLYLYCNGVSSGIASKAVKLNVWSHIAVVRISGMMMMIFVNGECVLQWTNAVNLAQGYLTIGSVIDFRDSSASYKYAGYIDQVRVTKGVARYSGVFTPPAVAFPVPV